ncbi:thiamine-monophosphate kinase [Mesorhizobium sp. B2-3-11]|uniref:thiamine-phosphate kinase n=1 Tax=Mesorhizobium sp. B2-3-11 TaxID=2589953 RepID=UPI00112AD486|nr:thiamine-phosphate kinase [Mesorhizobium sp. B2-3-11]TPL96405.1 thiamine-monophosphate kinase [Mesorhizobium sp. B2-3-11]
MPSELNQARLVGIAEHIFGDRHPLVVAGVGDDDCAVVTLNGQMLLLSCDLRNHRRYLETHAQLDFVEMGAFVVRQNCADIYGSGGVPLFLLLAVTLPGEVSEAQVSQLFIGVRDEALKFGAVVVGGDTKEGSSLVVGCTIVGSVPGEPWLLSGARSGDDIYVSGPLGGVTAAIALLELAHDGEHRAMALDVMRSASIDARQIRLLEGIGIRCGTDISDGLARALYNIIRRSHVGFAVDATLVPRHPLTDLAGVRLGLDPKTFAFGYGGDFQFVVTAPSSLAKAVVAAGFQRIGVVTETVGAEVNWGGGRVSHLADFGHDDFIDISPGNRFVRHWNGR